MGGEYAVSEVETPIGTLRLAASPAGLVRIALPRHGGTGFVGSLRSVLGDARQVKWLPSLEFTLALDLSGTRFQKRVWRALQGIPFGETRSYAEIARVVGSPKAFRAVGAANGANPLPIVVPCHRVINADGGLGGYGGGLTAKRRLLALEKDLVGEFL